MNIKSKKYYFAPKVNSVKLDNNIVLLAPSNPPGGSVQVEPERPAFPPSSAPPSTTSSPFGGNTPDYGDM